MTTSIKREIRSVFSRRSRAATAKKCVKKACRVVVLLIKPTAVLKSLSSDLRNLLEMSVQRCSVENIEFRPSFFLFK